MSRLYLVSTNVLGGMRFLARVITILIISGTVLRLFNTPAGHIELNPFDYAGSERVMGILLYLSLIALLLAVIRWEGFGGFVNITSLFIYSIVAYISTGKSYWNIWLLGIPGLLFIICWYYSNISEYFDVYNQSKLS